MSPEKLARMANQIGAFFRAQDPEGAPAAIADHLRKFWDPRMRRDIAGHLAAGGEGLDPDVAEAVRLLPEAAAKDQDA